MIAVVALVLLVCSGAGIYLTVGVGPATSTPAPATAEELLLQLQQQQLLQQQQTQTLPPSTVPPLCPNNYNPVVDINGKVYQNSCYAQSVGAVFAPTPYTTSPAPALTPANGTLNPVIAALLNRMPAATSTGTALDRSSPLVVQQAGRQSLRGGRVVQGGRGGGAQGSGSVAPS